MKIYTNNLNQVATYWQLAGFDAYGQPKLGKPKTIKCRWQASNKLFKDSEGREFVAEAIIYCGAEVELSGLIKLGKHRNNKDAKEIKVVQHSPSLDGKRILIKAVV